MRPLKRVAVIGAGVSGLATAKCLLDEGITPVVFEQSARIGGVWNYDETLADGGGIAYRSLRTNTSRQMMSFSDFSIPDTLPDFPPRDDVLAYLHAYADRFDLREHVNLQTPVQSIAPTADGQWLVRSSRGDQTYDAVVVCTGHDVVPAMPHYAGVETFKGKLIHSRAYKSPEPFAGQRVLVVGIGSSGADIATELSDVAQRVMLSTTRGGWFVPHYVGGRPWDHLLTRIGNRLPYSLRLRAFQHLITSEYAHMGLSARPSDWRFPTPAFDLWRARITPSSSLIRKTIESAIEVVPDVARIEGDGVHFADEQRAPVDSIILCTGYHIQFPFLDRAIVDPTGNHLDLYKRVFHPDLQTLAFVGIVNVGGPLPPVAEMQARWVSRVFGGAARLPSSAEMRADVARRRAEQSRRSPYPLRVQLLDYMDELAAEIGARPNVLRHLDLAERVLAGPVIAAQYRLDGAGAWLDAADVIKQCKPHANSL
ncbi:MAG: NAD(P)-binding domain-containing protein [Chloroflexota bacterium]